ncbi:FkbM family methyltransferase [Ruegeria arenilitoris]|uniref:FkbM family methyltransferase n=1 Tax=Ruegeria arenilitoris TaxID=1173585 RepID=UPI00147D7E06|nr:FkbM family methyltransferase [Ruegeria arenilitoris]
MSNEYFPMGGKYLRRFEDYVRQKCRSTSASTTQTVYSLLTRLTPGLIASSFEEGNGLVLVCQNGETIAFPSPMPLIKYSHVAYGYEEILKRKYTLPQYIEVERDDIVVDCGGFVGGFSLSASKLAKHVHLFEPDKMNARAARANLSQYSNVTINEFGLYNDDTELTFNISESAVEHSVLEPDDGAVLFTRRIQVKRLSTYFEEVGCEPDFVKIEAEGVEIEVFDGLENLRPKKIAIDVSPERVGQSPAEELQTRLDAKGYSWRRRHNVLFARREDS